MYAFAIHLSAVVAHNYTKLLYADAEGVAQTSILAYQCPATQSLPCMLTCTKERKQMMV